MRFVAIKTRDPLVRYRMMLINCGQKWLVGISKHRNDYIHRLLIVGMTAVMRAHAQGEVRLLPTVGVRPLSTEGEAFADQQEHG
jgi:hypothetical protein